MDGHRFDGITKALAEGVSRRDVLKTLAAGVGAAVLGALGLDETAASRICRADSLVCSKNADCCAGYCAPKDRTGRRRCGCPSGTVACHGLCLTPGTTSSKCGCGVQCGGCEQCVNGACTPVADDRVCGAGSICCSGQCVSNLSLDHCGACAQTCAGPQVCAASGCCLQAGATCGFTGEGECCVGACLQGSGIAGTFPPANFARRTTATPAPAAPVIRTMSVTFAIRTAPVEPAASTRIASAWCARGAFAPAHPPPEVARSRPTAATGRAAAAFVNSSRPANFAGRTTRRNARAAAATPSMSAIFAIPMPRAEPAG